MTAKPSRGRKPVEPGLNVRGPVPYLGIPVRVKRDEWGRANSLFGEVFAWLERERIVPAGPPFLRYRTLGGGETPVGLEVGVPVARPQVGDGRVVAAVLPAGAYATAVHVGHPDHLDTTRDELLSWLRRQDFAVATRRVDGREEWEARVESFLTDPAKEANPERWSIEIAYLLKRVERSPDEHVT